MSHPLKPTAFTQQTRDLVEQHCSTRRNSVWRPWTGRTDGHLVRWLTAFWALRYRKRYFKRDVSFFLPYKAPAATEHRSITRHHYP